jgi:hypothetical protein
MTTVIVEAASGFAIFTMDMISFCVRSAILAKERSEANTEKTSSKDTSATKISMATQNGIDGKNVVCNTTCMTNEKLTTDQLLCLATKLGVETNGTELSEAQKAEVAGKLVVMLLMMN